MPLISELKSEIINKNEKINSFEKRLIHWSQMIKKIIEKQPEHILQTNPYPTPLDELEFWSKKSQDLLFISEQLKKSEAVEMIEFLESNQSTFLPHFKKLKEKIQEFKLESLEIYTYLSTLEEYFEKMNNPAFDFCEIPTLYYPLMACLKKIYSQSKNYNKPNRMIMMIRGISNQIMNRAKDQIPHDLIISSLQSKEEIREFCDRLQITLDMCTKFKDAYFEYKIKSDGKWKFPTKALFINLDNFLERCYDIMYIASSIEQFNQLENCYLGGTKGKILTQNLKDLFNEFRVNQKIFMSPEYNVVDIKSKQFQKDFYVFREKMNELERRLASLISQNFEDLNSLNDRFKLLDSFEVFLQRPIIYDEMDQKYYVLIGQFKEELEVVGKIFEVEKQLIDSNDPNSPIYKNLPPTTGALKWTQSLRLRLKWPYEKIQEFDMEIKLTEEFKEIQQIYESLIEKMKSYDSQKILEWKKEIHDNCDQKLENTVLRKEGDSRLLAVNFDPGLTRLLREVRYFYQLNLEIPPIAQEIYKKDNSYRVQVNSLDMIVNMYNSVIRGLNNVEEPLFEKHIQNIDSILIKGIEELNWKSPQLDQFIHQSQEQVEKVYNIFNKMKEDMMKIKKILKELEESVVNRKNKTIQPEEYLSNHQAQISQVHQKFKQSGNAIFKLIKETLDSIKVDKKGKPWHNYLNMINMVVFDAIKNSVENSLMSLQKITELENTFDQSWLEINTILSNGKINYFPSFVVDDQNLSIYNLLKMIVEDVIANAIQINRIDTNSGDYLIELESDFDLKFCLGQIWENYDAIGVKIESNLDQFEPFKEFIALKPEEYFQEFLQKYQKKIQLKKYDSSALVGEEEKDNETISPQNLLVKELMINCPDMVYFEKEISSLRKKLKSLDQIHQYKTIGWLKINQGSLLSNLKVKIKEWIFCFMYFLTQQVNLFFKNCSDFKIYLKEGIAVNPTEDPQNNDLLMKVMIVLSQHRMVNKELDLIFLHIREVIGVLRKHQDFEYSKIEKNFQEYDYPGQMEGIKNSFEEIFQDIIQIKTSILDLQQNETQALKKRVNTFSEEVNTFQAQFKKEAPYCLEQEDTLEKVNSSFNLITSYREQLEQIKTRALDFSRLEDLFMLEKTKYKKIKECSTELKKLNKVWKLIQEILQAYEVWDKFLWKNIEIEDLNAKNEQFIQICKKIPRELKTIPCFNMIYQRTQNMKKTLNCIDMLKQDSMQLRHWEMVSVEIGQMIEPQNPAFSFKDINKLNIYKFENIVAETAENANKELKIGLDLNKINKNWQNLNFEFEKFDQAGGALQVFKSFDEIQEILDNDISKILSLLSQGKSVEVFKKELEEIKYKLNQVDIILNIWGKVQKNWKRLVNIFLLSDDIRNQLQEATKTFDEKNSQFRDLMLDVFQNPRVLDACTDDRKAELEEMYKHIEECEKKLNLYLEEKKKAFARFYFVSNQTLIDILSNGKDIRKISEDYLCEFFDGVKKVLIENNNDGKGDGAVGMIAKDGERVNFKSPFHMQDEIEIWLKHLSLKIRTELQLILQDCKKIADEHFNSNEIKPENKMDWIYDYCAQIALLVVQITWTDNVHKSFDDMEGGMTNAMKNCLENIKKRINLLIKKVRNVGLTKEIRNKIITIITIDVHSRDVVEKLIAKNINDKESFQWYSQLRFYYTQQCQDVLVNQKPRFEWEKSETSHKAVVRIVDWAKFYTYEYVGNTGRLVITPLTDRCYITLTQALSLNMGGAPAGPAGTGKTETTKDLGRACGLSVFVFNCSEQMNIYSMAQIFMGLAQTGLWVCFDEFNRISIEVLSVVSTQVKQILDALKEKRDNFQFMEEEISLEDTVGFFITMNPGYAGRNDLPENLKALFRSCAMVVPDLKRICENMLMSEGYEQARELSKKFVTLYSLSKSLLSQQNHYDWGLRAVKSVLRQAGKLKRNNIDKNENLLLFGALKDFNLPKIVTDDKPIFIRLLKDLFTEVKQIPEAIINDDLKLNIVNAAKELNYLPEDQFILKTVQLSEIMEVRHCVFIIGPPGCGKSSVWKTLAKASVNMGKPTEYDCLDPKAVSSDELFGMLNKSKEFKNGVLSSIIRNQSKNIGKYKASHVQKWSILDGDIDPEWIESLNTVMDDNKFLTLVSNDRFPLTPSMRLIFEITNLKYATPATVSRAGVLYINQTDIGWKPYYDSWLESHRENKITKEARKNKIIFDELAISVFMKCQIYLENPEIQRLKHAIPTVQIMMVETTCTIIDGYLFKHQKDLKNRKEEDLKLIYEGVFLYAAMWGIGGSFIPKGEESQYYKSFVRYWKSLAKIKYPEPQEDSEKNLEIFDYRFDVKSLNWIKIQIPQFDEEQEINFTKLFIPTQFTERVLILSQLHLAQNKPIMYLGNSGTGKSALMNRFINSASPDKYLKNQINFSSLTTSASLQTNLMNSGLSKLGMRMWGLGGGKKMLYFIDDINMPFVDKYDTQAPIALIRQILDYSLVYDRECLEEYNKLVDIYFCACLNPKSGSFSINTRLQRHFSVFCIPDPTDKVIEQIYNPILNQHFGNFGSLYEGLSQKIVKATISLYSNIINDTSFNPSAKKFHYQFNLRELSKVTEGILKSDQEFFKDDSFKMIKLWIHEIKRVFEDRLIFQTDKDKFTKYLDKSFKLATEGMNVTKEQIEEAMSNENIHTSFQSIISGEPEKIYLPIESLESTKKILMDKLGEYNENNAQMNLVLFNQAIMHITRISRILDSVNGHALLVGVGGSGKQSLTKLTAYLQNYDLDIMPPGQMSIVDFKQMLGDIIKKVTKPPGTQRILMITDLQIDSDEMLISINDILNNGYIPGLWPKEELDTHLMTMKNEARQQGIADTPENLFQYFIEKIKKNLHLVLCMSPVGNTLRIRARKFPGLINSTHINWFHAWQKEALIDVAESFLKDIEFPVEDLAGKIAENMALTHYSLNDINQQYLVQEKRYNYTTPKSYLDLIGFYKYKLREGREKIEESIESLSNGLLTLSETQNKVKGIEEELKIVMVEVEKKKAETQKLIEKVNTQKDIANQQQIKANEEEKKTMKCAEEANEVKKKAEEAYLSAKPKLENAQQALSRIQESKISIMKNLKNPPKLVVLTGKVLLFVFKGEKIDLFSEKNNSKDWKAAMIMMNNVKRFLQDLKHFSNETAKNLSKNVKDKMKKLINSGKFNVSDVMETSQASGNLADWAHNIIAFNEAFNIVKPLEEEKEKAEALLKEKNKQLDQVKAKVKNLNDKVMNLEKKLNEAMKEQESVENERQKFLDKLQRAEKLVKGLASENLRWTQNVENLKKQRMQVIGDSLLAAEFVSYIGPFSSNFRKKLTNEIWMQNIQNQGIPLTPNTTPLSILSDGSTRARWKNQGLPEDEMSLQNASIVISSKRWPLMIDPQLQGTKWLKGMYQELIDQEEQQKIDSQENLDDENEETPNPNELIKITLGSLQSIRKLKMAITYGQKVLLENIKEDIDPSLNCLLSQSIITKSKTKYVEFGTDLVEYSQDFKLYLQCKMQNPHFRPETAAQCTIINFIVTDSGLEDQLLAMVVNLEKQELELKKQNLVRQQNQFEVTLSDLEASLLHNLSKANPETILDDKVLIENLDNTKQTAIKISEQKEEAKKTEVKINREREKYRELASEGSMLFFLIIKLNQMNNMYQYSLESFVHFFFKAINSTETQGEERVQKLVLNTRKIIYQWISRGLFEDHKIVFLTLITFRLIQKGVIKLDWSPLMMNFLLNSVPKNERENKLSNWLPNQAWQFVQRLAEIPEFEKLPDSIEKELPGRFKEWFNDTNPENLKLPSEWRKLEQKPFLKLCVIKALRPDRMTASLYKFILKVLPEGEKFIKMDQNFSFKEILEHSLTDATQEGKMNTPLFFILSPGADPVKEVEEIGRKMKFQYNLNNFFNIALGQGQEVIANNKLEIAFKEGYWVMLQNIHLMPSWLNSLDKRLEQFSKEDGCHPNFRLYLSAEPNKNIPVGILEKCINLTNEPPSGLKANFKRAWTYFNKDEINEKDGKYNHILYSLCYFHSVLIERRKFGPRGWNIFYPFNIGDLRDSYLVLMKNAENNSTGKIPWDDLKYIFGEIMYGGHIVDDWDRRLCNTYLENIMTPHLFQEDFQLYPYVDGKTISFKMPMTNSKYDKYLEEIERQIQEESSLAYGLHPNAEIDLGTNQCKMIFETLNELIPREQNVQMSKEISTDIQIVDHFFQKIFYEFNLKERIFNIEDIKERIVEMGPFQNVFLQECEYMNALIIEITSSIYQLDQGIKGILTVNDKMEQLISCLLLEKIPEFWLALAYPTKRFLSSFLDNMVKRIDQLAQWAEDPQVIPLVTHINMLFNPQSFLTAIKQDSGKGDLNKLTIQTEFTKKSFEDFKEKPPKDGAYVYGFLLEGASWDVASGNLVESKPKEMYSVMPVCLCKAVQIKEDSKKKKTTYNCPVYRTADRGNTYIFEASLRSHVKNPSGKWILGGVAMICEVEGVSDQVKLK